MLWYVCDREQVDGPLSEGAILQRLRDGRMSATARVRADGEDGWRPLENVEPFRSALQPTGADTGKLSVRCDCGKRFVAPPEAAGRRATCTSCGRVLTIPAAAMPIVSTTAATSRPTSPAPLSARTHPLGSVPTAPLGEAMGGAPAGQTASQVAAAIDIRIGSVPPVEERVIWEGRPAPAYLALKMLHGVAWLLVWLTLAAYGPKIAERLSNHIGGLAGVVETQPFLQGVGDYGVVVSRVFLVLGAWALWRLVRVVLAYLNIYYIFTTQRLRFREGLFSRRFTQMELFRVKDTVVVQPVFGRLFGYAHLRFVSSDVFMPDKTWVALPGGVALAEKIRLAAQVAREQARVVPIDG